MSDEGQHKPTNVDEKTASQRAAPKRSWTRWILPAVALVSVVAVGMVLHGRMRDDVWAYYTDDEGLKVEVQEKKERMVLWEDPQQNLFQAKKPDPDKLGAPDPVNQASERIEATFSADGTMMVLTRWSQDFEKTELEETGADLYLSTWNGRTWRRPEPLVGLNTASNERGAAFSRDGKYLFFCSDREGGAGGYDIYVARQNGETWTAAERLNEAVNSARNETGPAPSTDDKKLYFSSDRDASHEVQDIYVADRVAAKTDSDKTDSEKAATIPASQKDPQAVQALRELPPVPVFALAEPVSSLNSRADDIEAALTGRGNHVFLASDRDRDQQSGFHLYLSRVIGGRVLPPQKVDVYIKRGNATDPAVRMEGFDLLFSADGDLAAGEKEADPKAADVAAAEPGYRLYRSTTREVIGYTDLARWELFKDLMHKILWWVLLAIAALIALIYLLEKWRDITNLFHKCLAGSVMAHLLLLLLMMSWLISQALDEGGDQQSPEIALSADALAQEELAMESQQELAQVARTTQLIVTKNVQEFREVAFNPTEVATNPVPVVRKTSDQSLVSNFRPSKASESTQTETVSQPKADAPVLMELTPTKLPALEVEQLEVAQAPSARKVEAVDTTRDDFQRNDQAIQQVKTNKAQTRQAESQKVDVQSDAKNVASSSQPERTTDTVDPVDGLEAADSSQKLENAAANQALAENLPGGNPVDGLTDGLELEVAAVDSTKGDFQGDEGAIQQVQSGKAQTGQAGNQQVDVQSGSGSVASSGQPAPTTDTGGDTINPTDGLEAENSPPPLAGTALQLALAANLPGHDPFDVFPLGEKFETPKHDLDGKNLSNAIKELSGRPSLKVIESLGGSGATERAIGMGLDWFSNHQEPAGHWDMGKHSSKSQYNTSGAGLALLCYYGWGIKHGDYGKNSKHPRHVEAVGKALDWMLKQQKKDGSLRGGGRMYCHGIASIALCEAYGLTMDPKLKGPATKATDFIVRAQHADGGWRYEPGQPGDLSVVGWQYMALHSARMAGIAIPDEVFEKTGRFLDSVGGGKQGGLYNYMGRGGGSLAMVPCGMFLRQLDLARPTEPRMQESANYVKAHMIKAGRVDHYADYYSTLALYQHQGPIWREWNKNLKEVYVASQITTGDNKGSWEPQGNHSKAGGRVLGTGLAVLSLEVYYRLLPMYGFVRDKGENKPPAGKAP